MDLENPDNIEKLEKIFMPHMAKGKENHASANNKFVHYTSAENAINILNSKTLWMRSPRCMNDYMEISFGHQQLVKFFNTKEHRQRFIAALDDYEAGIAEEVLNQFDEWWNKIQNDTFIASISVHPESEDLHGRLSMWRAYGEQPAKAALVLNNPPKSNKNIGLILSPAAYFTYEDLENELLNIISSIEDNIDYLKSLDKQAVVGTTIVSLIILAVCLKHPGFKEEQEWRIIHLPQMTNPNGWIQSSVETISGVPQVVYKIPLENDDELEITGLGLHELIDKVLIGPTQYPLAVYDAFCISMNEAGIEDPVSKITVSDIPLRT
ncbi:DUF2971 domain-containing protein [Shewanella sp. UCD-KL12]|uniref:DUF2971 domain-containing protein n=1 Tax=Shewanella sp. UCD-KL12 TaxID=1917163 RepID=UPI000970B3FE|nr:DUF2971 domain-containing protein [Shewanella sp. UCD-KL12]